MLALPYSYASIRYCVAEVNRKQRTWRGGGGEVGVPPNQSTFERSYFLVLPGPVTVGEVEHS